MKLLSTVAAKCRDRDTIKSRRRQKERRGEVRQGQGLSDNDEGDMKDDNRVRTAAHTVDVQTANA